MMQIL